MLRFSVFEGDRPAREWSLRHAHLIGKEDGAVAAQIEFALGGASSGAGGDVGLIVCRKAARDAAALGLQYDAGEEGVLTLRTCLLPERDEPYLLERELARHRIMLVLNKLEEWQLSALPSDHPVLQDFEDARALFTSSLIAPGRSSGGFSAEQATLARQSLSFAIRAGRRLAKLKAERSLEDRLRPDVDGKPTSAPRVGSVVHHTQFSEPLTKVASSCLDFLSCPMRWCDIEAEEGRFAFKPTDRWIEWAVRTGKLPVVAGPVLDFARGVTPGWLHVWEHDYESVREFAYEHAKRVVTRYRRTVSRWTVISGVNLNHGFNFSIDQMVELTRLAVLLTRKLHPAAKTVVEVAQPWGEHATSNPESVPPKLYTELVLEAGVAADAIGLKLVLGDRSAGCSMRDLAQLSALLDEYGQFERPLHVTAMGVPASPVEPGDRPESGERDDPGRPSSGWTAEAQAEWLASAAVIALSKPAVRSVAWQALFDSEPAIAMPHGGLIGPDGRARPALRRLRDLRGDLRQLRVPVVPVLDAAVGDVPPTEP